MIGYDFGSLTSFLDTIPQFDIHTYSAHGSTVVGVWYGGVVSPFGGT